MFVNGVILAPFRPAFVATASRHHYDATGAFIQVDAINHDRSPFPVFEIAAGCGTLVFSLAPFWGHDGKAILKIRAVDRQTAQDTGGSGFTM
ncbi:hypothetical protein CFR76_02200 [Komagataeibacter swingsii]|uniref:Uncharacterized protein n=1 Tax=Komagataeibacter swingsii TaxID=215220 RepID=A0A2V4SFN6_9PROT|nr:hypothetical protein CFR76_02200 [Komagataeibacter swingsii]